MPIFYPECFFGQWQRNLKNAENIRSAIEYALQNLKTWSGKENLRHETWTFEAHVFIEEDLHKIRTESERIMDSALVWVQAQVSLICSGKVLARINLVSYMTGRFWLELI